MIFEESKVYTAVNAHKLHIGDLVFGADTMYSLRTVVKYAEERYPGAITAILSEDEEYRFTVSGESSFQLVYIICPARNADAYKEWREGKCIKEIGLGIDEWAVRNPREHRVTDDEWFSREFRPALEQAPASPTYRPYKNVDELIMCYKHSHNYKDNEDIMPLIWVKKDAAKKKKLITAFFEEENLVSVDGEIYDLEYLYKDYTFLDGTPCGVEEV